MRTSYVILIMTLTLYTIQAMTVLPVAAAQETAAAGLVREGDEALASGDYKKALELYRVAVEEQPKDAAAQEKLAEVCLNLHLEQEALRAAQSAASLAPEDPGARAVLAKALIRNGDSEGGLAEFEKLPADQRGLYELGLCVEAARLAAEGQDYVGKFYESQDSGDLDAGVEKLESAARADPDNLAIKKTLGWLYIDKVHDSGNAYGHLAEVVRQQPDDLDTKKLLAVACSGTGRFDRAISLCREVLVSEPDDLWMRITLAKALASAGHYDQAASTYEEVLRLDPNNLSAGLGLAEIMAWRGETREAVAHCHSLVAQHPESPEVHSLLGDLHRWDWDLGQARTEYNAALELRPAYYAAVSGLTEIEKLKSVRASGKYYTFEDADDFARSFASSSLRVPLSDTAYVTAEVSRWRLELPGSAVVRRFDKRLDLEHHSGKELETHLRFLEYDYTGRRADQGFGVSATWSPTPGTNVHVSYTDHEPVLDSFITARDNLHQDIYGIGLDTKLGGQLSAQGSYSHARYSDRNTRRDTTLQLSIRVLRKPETIVRLRAWILGYRAQRPQYWSPSSYETYGPIINVSHDLGESSAAYLKVEAPYVKDQSRWGNILTFGLRAEVGDRLEVDGSYFDAWMPGEATSWSGDGFQISVSYRF